MAALDPVEAAATLGSQPFLLLALMLATGACSMLLLVFVVRWSDAHARAVWRRASGAWANLAARPAMRALEARAPSIWRTMRALTATEYLLLHLAIGFAIVVAGLCFVSLASWVDEKKTMVAVDLTLAQSLHTSASPAGVSALHLYTMFGGGWGVTILGIVVAVILVLKKRRLLAIGWAVALAGAGILNRLLKAAFVRPRPIFDKPLEVEAGWSFPSGHAMATIVAAGMLAYVGFLFVRQPGKRLAIAVTALLWTVAMGFSRMYLGVHYLSDVLAGFSAGTVWLGACITGLEIARRGPARRASGE